MRGAVVGAVVVGRLVGRLVGRVIGGAAKEQGERAKQLMVRMVRAGCWLAGVW